MSRLHAPQVVIKDGEVMPGWTDEDQPSTKEARAVIPGGVQSALFYLMMSGQLTNFRLTVCRGRRVL